MGSSRVKGWGAWQVGGGEGSRGALGVRGRWAGGRGLGEALRIRGGRGARGLPQGQGQGQGQGQDAGRT